MMQADDDVFTFMYVPLVQWLPLVITLEVHVGKPHDANVFAQTIMCVRDQFSICLGKGNGMSCQH